ncbi:hypothetical protein [Corynebacterium alimapuense]|uniref:hypothetical protein n=1 Tax=Corynebacterium alimapuense TaxID=1576874 RepID=UPI000F7FB1B7|nr:hypothetical protein [Corynebacterium alimapuense]
MLASAVAVMGLLPAVASAQSERIVTPEERDDYVAEFYVDPDNPPVIDGVRGFTEAEIDEYRDKARQAEASGPPQDEITPGELSIRALNTSLCAKVDSSTANFGGISIPASYDYWGCFKKEASPDPSSFSRHDYCTQSPDQFPSPGKNAEFSGACSKHDICYDNTDAQRSGYGPCNSNLFDNMVTICAANYGLWDPRHATCMNTAGVYWTFVTGTHIDEN